MPTQFLAIGGSRQPAPTWMLGLLAAWMLLWSAISLAGVIAPRWRGTWGKRGTVKMGGLSCFGFALSSGAMGLLFLTGVLGVSNDRWLFVPVLAGFFIILLGNGIDTRSTRTGEPPVK